MQVRILKLSQTKPDAKAITEIETERDHWKEKYEGTVVEKSQPKAFYEELLKSTKGISPVVCDEGPQNIFELQEQLHQEGEAAQQWKYKCEGLNQELIKWKSQCALWEAEVNKLKQECSELAGKLSKVETTMELECYRAESRVRKQWEACEDRLVQQLKELQYQKQPKDVSVNASYTLTGLQKSPQYSTSHYQSTKGVQWVNVENISEEDPMVMGEKVSQPVVGNLGSSDILLHLLMFFMLPCHMYLVM